MKKQERKKGITLIALVITIIILLILAGVGITVVINGGIIQQAQNASDEYKKAQEEEQNQLNELYAYLNGEGLPENTPTTNAGTNVRLPDKWATVTPNYVSDENGKVVIASKIESTVYAVSDGKGNTVPVPIGFYYVGGNLETGVIISDNKEDKYDGKTDKTTWEYTTKLKGNQFVWIPCKEEEYKKCNVWNGTSQSNYHYDFTIDTLEKMQVQKYEGYYVGRYEAGLAETIEEFTETQIHMTSNQIYNKEGIPQSRAGKIPWMFIDWNYANKNSESMYSNSYIQSGLITGTQWDTMLNMIVKQTDLEEIDLTNSDKFGNYRETQIEYKGRKSTSYYSGGHWNVPVFEEETEGVTRKYTSDKTYGDLLTTGASRQTEVYHIYDIAGNLCEWTNELSFYGGNTSNPYCENRGGGYIFAKSTYPIYYRRGDVAMTTTCCYLGFRVVLYMK